MGRGDRLGHLRVADRGGPEDDPLGPGGDGLLDLLRVAQAAAELDRNVDRRHDPADVLEVDGLARAGAVKVDHVEPAGAAVHPAQGRDDRIVVVGRLLVVIALDEPDGLAVADVNRRIEDQLQMRMKLAKQAEPRGARLLRVELDAVERRALHGAGEALTVGGGAEHVVAGRGAWRE